jgi:hypothetical protein
LLVGKSTVPAGTAERLAEQIAAARGDELELAWNPEFLREGFAVEDTLTPDRLVFGVRPGERGQRAEQQLREAYEPVLATGTPVVVTDFATAQLVKVAANAFLATKISFINAMAEVCEATGGDVTLLSKALSYDTRIGGRFLHAGLGFGGGCLPKDIRAFMARAGELGVDQALSFLKEVDAINLRRRARMIDLAREQVGGSFGGMRVAVLGAAFKPNSDDIRDSPALDVAATIQKQGAAVTLYDPQAMDNARVKHPELGYRPARSRPPRAPTSCCTSPSGRSSARWTRPCSARSSPTGASSTAATPSTPPPGAPPAGPTAPSAAPRTGRRDAPEPPCRREIHLLAWRPPHARSAPMTTVPADPPLVAQQLGGAVAELLSWLHDVAPRHDRSNEVVALVAAHLGEGRRTSVVVREVPPFEQVNLQVALDAWIAAPGREVAVHGLALNEQYGPTGLQDIVHGEVNGPLGLSAPDVVDLPTGPDRTQACWRRALLLVQDARGAYVVLVRGPQRHEPGLDVQIAGLPTAQAQEVHRELAELRSRLNVYRGQVLEMQGDGTIEFPVLPRPRARTWCCPTRCSAASSGTRSTWPRGAASCATPASTSSAACCCTARPAPARPTPPATSCSGSRARPSSCCRAARCRSSAWSPSSPASCSRRRSCSRTSTSSPRTAGTATGRARALRAARRHGRRGGRRRPAVPAHDEPRRPARAGARRAAGPRDVAVEIDLPEPDARRRLFDVYSRGVPLAVEPADVDAVVERTAGVTASFLKELVRRAVLESLTEHPGALREVTAAHLSRALDDLLDSTQSVTRRCSASPATSPGRRWRADGPRPLRARRRGLARGRSGVRQRRRRRRGAVRREVTTGVRLPPRGRRR